MSNTVFNQLANHMIQPMFFGEDTGVARYEEVKHEKFEELTTKQLSFFWRPEEVNLTTDKAQFDKLWETGRGYLQEIFTNNLGYQILMDSVQGRAPAIVLASICSDVALETWIMTWTFSETIHSRSYTHIIRNLYSDPSKIFDGVVANKEIMARATAICERYDKLHELVILYQADKIRGVETKEQLREVKKALYMCLHAINALEAIRFYVSFISTWNFFENMKIMEGNMKIMQFIARDENLHHQGTRYILQQMNKGIDGTEWREIALECKEEAEELFMEVRAQERAWAQYVYRNGCPDGLTVELVWDFIDYQLVPSMNNVGLTCPIERPKRHPLPWINKYLKASSVQVAKQEAELSSYLISQIDNDVDDNVIAQFRDKYLPKRK
ncbi:aerobic NDP reductase small subunit [Acinetobacter phage vB_ApiM_fHyAci03]|uniref:ribonucleoside-diphosphate reductase n=1 Tax=Acinetobacter phage vB_ApiM_fHyAci03 TaxID=2269366 RepID=A0A345AV55_9CAUD|nr:aerobic NDP reductase small subunit [Acinetobacter phage vB_ApiM_fHyAci03]AXF40788.1 aerobic NDP reductase, small subunit [Acinetobacter phage vB_ApiM_fHyAci03]